MPRRDAYEENINIAQRRNQQGLSNVFRLLRPGHHNKDTKNQFMKINKTMVSSGG